MEKTSHLKKGAALLLTALIVLSAWGQEYATKSGTAIVPAERTPAFFSPADKYADNSVGGTYFIVTTPDLLPTLQPFIKWKRQQGFRVETLCYANPHRDSLRAHLLQRYTDAHGAASAPKYILLAGDIDRIPAFQGKYRPDGLNNHVTDLYYGEYTGDYVPEALVGRLSASDSTEMSQIVAKIIAYEQGQWAAEYRQLLLVAGKEYRSSAPITTNGQLHYLSELAARHRPDADTLCFYNPYSDSLSKNILATLKQGNLLVNYTAHCLSTGWSYPFITIHSLDTLDNPVPTVYVNNCCLTNAFNGTCFGEELLRLPQGGAVAVIGATNETLWDEDFYWAVGAKRPPVINPLFDSLFPGAFDTLIAFPDETSTLGSMLYAGCKAVSLSGSPFDAFYWEIYSLLGDPSMTPFWPHADTLILTSPDNLMAGSTALSLHSNRPCRISVTQDTALLASAQTSASGDATLTLSSALHGDSITLTASNPASVSHILTIPLQRPAQPFLAVIEHRLDDTLLTVRLKNVGSLTAHGHQLHLSQDSADRSTGATIHYASSCTIHQLAPLSDTLLTLRLNRLTLGEEPILNAKLTLTDSLGQSYSTLPLHITLPDRYPRLIRLLLLEIDSIPAKQLLPDHDYIIQADLSSPADSLTLYADNRHMVASSHSPTSYTFPCHTPANMLYLPLSLISHIDNWHGNYSYWLTAHHTTEPFETGDFSTLPWHPTVTNPWQIDSTAPYNGRYCARSASIDNTQKSVLTLDLQTLNDDTLSFYYFVSSEARDWLYFFIDSRRTGYWSGNSGWQQYTRPLPAGKHRLQWVYQKDAHGSEREDCARIDDIRLPLALWTRPSGIPVADSTPLATLQPVANSIAAPFSLFPNPTRGTVTITFPSSLDTRTIQIYDTYGRLTDAIKIPPCASSTQYSTTHLRLGTYTLVLLSGMDIHTNKLTVIR